MGNARNYQEYVEVLEAGNPGVRNFQEYLEVLEGGNSGGRLYQLYVEALALSVPAARNYQQYVELLHGPAALDEDADNTLSMSQSATTTISYVAVGSSTLSLTSSANLAQLGEAENTLVLTQSATLIVYHDREVSSTLVLTQRANFSYPFAADNTLVMTSEAARVHDESAESTLTLAHDVDVSRYFSVASDMTADLSHTVEVSATFDRTVNQGMALVQSATRHMYWLREISHTLTLVGTAAGVSSKLASSTLVLSQTAVGLIGKKAKNTLVLTQLATRTITRNKSAQNVLGLGQSRSLSKTVRRDLTSTLVLTQTVVGFAVKPASSTLVLTQDAVGEASKNLTDLLEIFDEATFTRDIGAPVDQVLNIDHDIVKILVKNVSVTSPWSMNQFVRATKSMPAVASNTLVLSQDLVRDRTIAPVNHTLTLVQTVDKSKLATLSASNALVLTQTVTLAKTTVRLVINNLVFLSSHRRQIGIGGDGDGGTDVDNVDGNIIKRLVILKTADSIITLPTPEFNDLEGGKATINIKRSMAGGRRVYKKNAPARRLSYNFIMDRKKAIELRQFILNNNSKVLDMENWKGEKWKVVLTNNPFQFTEEALWQSDWGNKSSVTLEFEGGKIN